MLKFAYIARTWWITEEAKLTGQATWKEFTDGFDERFFLETARKEMEERFINLRQWNRSIVEYAAEFLRLSHFPTYMVADETKRAGRFQQGLKLELQKALFPQQLKTYSVVLSMTRGMEQLLRKDDIGNGQSAAGK